MSGSSRDRWRDVVERLQRVEDQLEIGQLIARYGHAVDDRDLDALGELYSESSRFEGSFGTSTGRQAVVEYYRDRLGAYGPTYHYPHSHVIEFVSDDEATGEVAAHAELDVDGETVVVALRYQDRYVREDGRWRFLERRARTLYAAPHAEFDRLLGQELRNRRPGRPPRPAELPEGQASWRRFEESRKGTAT